MIIFRNNHNVILVFLLQVNELKEEMKLGTMKHAFSCGNLRASMPFHFGKIYLRDQFYKK